MRNSAIKVAILAGSTMLLAACNNGGGGDSAPVPLETKSDGLRELGTSIGGAGFLVEHLDFPSSSADRSAKASRANAKALPDCNTVTGSVTYSGGSKDRDFKLLEPAASGVRVYFDGQVRANYEQHECFGEDEGNSDYFRADGALEEGTGGSSDAVYYYYSAGSGDTPAYDLNESRQDGQLYARQYLDYLGTIERFETPTRIVQAFRLSQKREFFERDERDTKLSFDLGDGNAPLRLTTTSDSLSVEGSYRYSTGFSGCKGGKVEVSTPSQGGIAFTDSRPSGGELRLRSGGSTASFTFNNDGGATLVINGAPGIVVTPEEVEAALVAESSPCVEDNNPL